MKVQGHRHNASVSPNVFLRFLSYLLRPKKVYFHFDDTAVCGECGTPIRAPYVYYHLGLKLSYAVSGAFGAVLWRLLFPDQTSFIVILLYFFGFILVYHRLITAVVLSFGEWEPYNPEKFDVNIESILAKKNLYSKLLSAGYGAGIALFLVVLQLTL